MVRHESPLARDADARARAETIAAGSGRLSPAEQIDVYREQFWIRHVGSLQEDYPSLEALLGVAGFEALCRGYLRAFPPDVFALRDLAANMARFVAETTPYRDAPLLADCARAEWAFIDAFDAADAPPFDASSLAATPEDKWPEAVLRFHPSLRTVRMAHPAHEFRNAVRRRESPSRPEPAATHLVVFRLDETVRYRTIDALPFALLERLMSGEPLGPACERVAAEAGADEDALGEQVALWFQAWVADGWLSSISV